MTQFKVNDRVKVVRESESDPDFNDPIAKHIGESGYIRSIDTEDNIHTVILDDTDDWFIPADMLELEVSHG